MASVNKVILIGNLGRDPEVRYAPSGSAICNVTIATSRNWKDKTSGEKPGRDRVAPRGPSTTAGRDRRRVPEEGPPVYIEGRLKTRKWTDKDGVEKYTTEIIANEMQLLGGREGMAAVAAWATATWAPPRPAQRPPAPRPGAPARPGRPASTTCDDIPF
jgi:single-strand DNA-binding protein